MTSYLTPDDTVFLSLLRAIGVCESAVSAYVKRVFQESELYSPTTWFDELKAALSQFAFEADFEAGECRAGCKHSPCQSTS